MAFALRHKIKSDLIINFLPTPINVPFSIRSIEMELGSTSFSEQLGDAYEIQNFLENSI